MEPQSLESYVTEGGYCPFEVWEAGLAVAGQIKVRQRLMRVSQGNLGNVNTVGSGVHELKFSSKGLPCYRVYFANVEGKIILLLCGGDKSDQANDIDKAKEYWIDYKRRKNIVS